MTKQLLTNIDISKYMFVADQAKKKNMSKRMFIEHMIDTYKKLIEEKQLDEAYERMGNDEEYLTAMEENARLLGTL